MAGLPTDLSAPKLPEFNASEGGHDNCG